MSAFTTTPLPVGVHDVDEDDCGDHRLIFTPDFKVPGVDDLVFYASGYQQPDGTVWNGAGDIRGPKIWLAEGVGMTAAQTRALAATLTELACLVDSWVGAA